MRQLLLRVPDDLHARLAARAQERGQSVNALATELLDHLIEEDPASVRRRLRAKAHQLGVLAEPHAPRRKLSRVERQTALDSARGLGEVVDAILEDGR
ncbi:HicB-like protein involved in pilus formation [Kribbella sp. VKM Ac-2527]|uniref:HicB-like protein involved in pilus formation n=1 Tax=Kribbella caucasensis TaxID=2512215 RepID=A0A4R6K9B8_9ACTN|nr:toxin-antitoxin system HicB family antitoxin [Kribbella sp. VKM Ac-2527]TDO44055.1 HicB-like protein involved in pilus formation [Kribbella sp. VKM Ac-2527]